MHKLDASNSLAEYDWSPMYVRVDPITRTILVRPYKCLKIVFHQFPFPMIYIRGDYIHIYTDEYDFEYNVHQRTVSIFRYCVEDVEVYIVDDINDVPKPYYEPKKKVRRYIIVPKLRKFYDELLVACLLFYDYVSQGLELPIECTDLDEITNIHIEYR